MMSPNSKTQQDTGLAFAGSGQETNPRARGNLQVNRFTGYMNDGRLVNKPRGPTVGNHGCENPSRAGASTSVTKDPYMCPPTSSMPKLPPQGSRRDNINRGAQVRGSGMTTVRKPTNSDAIRMGQSGGPGYGQTTRSSRPATRANSDSFNYGPRSQY